MKTDPHSEAAIPLVPYRQVPWILLLLIAAILAITWPWAKSFSTAFLAHWDPPFHAWKLEFVARTLLSGHLLPVDGNTNMYYPHSGTLYFEALHWPQALVAAVFFGLTNFSPVLVYHIVLVLFWALSGVCLWMLLLALGTTRRAALLGAFFFTFMPYRMSYSVEFNMQLCFGLPLFFFFMVRFFQRPSIRYACGMALAWWLQATSELYQAVFLLLILPFPGIALMADRWPLLGSFRRFWLPALCAAALGGILSFVFLGPYLTMLNVHEVNRDLHEVSHHILEPLSYLNAGGRFHLLGFFDARGDEMTVYPTLALILLAAAHLVFDARRLARISVPRWVWIVRSIRWTALLLFMVLAFRIYYDGASDQLGTVYSLLPVVATFAALLVLFHPTERDTPSLFTTGLFAGAVFAFFLSMGPQFVIRHSQFTADNTLYCWIYQHLAALHGFRVVSRFSLFVLLYLIVAAALAWSRIERGWLKRPALRWLWIVPLLVGAYECMPNPFHFRPLEYPLTTPVLDRLDRMEKPYVIAMVPMGAREYDSRYMLQIARTDRLFVYAWGGAYPRYTKKVLEAMNPQDPKPARVAKLLRLLWPECFILEDKSFSQSSKPEWLTDQYLRKWIPCNYAQAYSNETEVLAEDDRFVLLRLKPEAAPATEQIRLIRHDYLLAKPRLTFRARTPADIPSATLWLDVNGYVIGRWELTPEPREFHVAVPPGNILPILPNRFRFHATDNAPFYLDTFEPGPSSSVSAFSEAERLAHECPPWLGHVHGVPETAIPLNIHYPNGFAILACEPLETTASMGGVIRLRHYVQCPSDIQVAANMSLHSRLRAPDGQWIEEKVSMDADGDINDVRCQVHPAIYALEQTIPIPERLGPGDYELLLVLRNEKGKRLKGEQNGKSGKLFPVPVPIRIQAPAGP